MAVPLNFESWIEKSEVEKITQSVLSDGVLSSTKAEMLPLLWFLLFCCFLERRQPVACLSRGFFITTGSTLCPMMLL